MSSHLTRSHLMSSNTLPLNLPADKSQARILLKTARHQLGQQARNQADSALEMRLFASEFWRTSTVVCTYYSIGEEVRTQVLIERALEQGKLVLLPRLVKGSKRLHWYRYEKGGELERSAFGVLEPPCVPDQRVDVLRTASLQQAIQAANSEAIQAANGEAIPPAPLSAPAVTAESAALATLAAVGAPTALPRMLVVVPGLCFDRSGYRLGYGGGYYDQFLLDLKARYGQPASNPEVLIGNGQKILTPSYTTVGLCREQFFVEQLCTMGLTDGWDQPVAAVLTQHSILYGDTLV